MNFDKPIVNGFSGLGGEFKKLKKKRKRVGRGTGSGMGKTSTRGSNGQKSRSGCALRNFEGGQKTITSLPRRGFNSIKKESDKYNIVHIGRILDMINESIIDKNQTIDKEVLLKTGVVKTLKRKIKLLFDVEADISFNIKVDSYSKNAFETIKKAGGSCL
jgi:large subunit ribosomal protein L15